MILSVRENIDKNKKRKENAWSDTRLLLYRSSSLNWIEDDRTWSTLAQPESMLTDNPWAQEETLLDDNPWGQEEDNKEEDSNVQAWDDSPPRASAQVESASNQAVDVVQRGTSPKKSWSHPCESLPMLATTALPPAPSTAFSLGSDALHEEEDSDKMSWHSSSHHGPLPLYTPSTIITVGSDCTETTVTSSSFSPCPSPQRIGAATAGSQTPPSPAPSSTLSFAGAEFWRLQQQSAQLRYKLVDVEMRSKECLFGLVARE